MVLPPFSFPFSCSSSSCSSFSLPLVLDAADRASHHLSKEGRNVRRRGDRFRRRKEEEEEEEEEEEKEEEEEEEEEKEEEEWQRDQIPSLK